MQKFRVYVAEKSYLDYSMERKVVDKAGGKLFFARCSTEDDILTKCKNAHALLLRQTPIGEKAFKGMADLLVVSRYGVGYDNVDITAATRYGVLVTIVPDYCIGEVADHTIALLMAAIRRIPLRDRFIRFGSWDLGEEYPVSRTENKVLGLVGYGKTAREVRKRLSGFPFHFVACDPQVPKEVFADDRTVRVDFPTLLKLSDYISIHLPLTQYTMHLFDISAFRSMKKNALLVNTSRGQIVNTEALYTALKEGMIIGAALDVYESEPLSPENPFRFLSNVILSDHAAWYSEESQRELQTRAALEVARALTGVMPENLVNPEALFRFQASHLDTRSTVTETTEPPPKQLVGVI